jgi:hypothetical protein
MAPLLVLNVTTSEATMSRMMDLAHELAPAGNSYQLFQCAPQFGRYFKPGPPMPELLRAPWSRVGILPLRIDNA